MILTTKNFQLAVHASGDRQAKQIAIVCPGYLDTKDYPHMKSLVDFLAARDYYAVSFDPPGTWESPGDIALYKPSSYLAAINELIAHFDNRPTLVVGHSMGGSMAMHAAINNPHVTAFAALMSDPSFVPGAHDKARLQAWQETGYRLSLRDEPDIPGQSREIRVPYSFSQDAQTYTAIEGLKTLAKPKLFVAGKQDAVITPARVQSTYTLAMEPKSLAFLDAGHDYRRDPAAVTAMQVILDNYLRTLASV